MDKRLGKFWPGLVLSVVCVGVVIALVGLVGYFPVGGAGAPALGWLTQPPKALHCSFFLLFCYYLREEFYL